MKEVNRFTDILNQVKEVHCVFQKSTEVFENNFSEGMVKDAYHFERPDILIPVGDKVILFEQFQFDSSNRKKRSSIQKKEMAHFDRIVMDKLSNPPEKGVLITKHEFKTPASIEKYENNLNAITMSHLKKYDEYIANYMSQQDALSKQGLFSDKIEFGLIIESTSILPDIIKSENSDPYLLTPFHLKSFREILRKHKFVEHVFYICGNGSSSYVIYYMYNNDYSDEEYDDVFSIAESDVLIVFTPFGLSGVMQIPTNLTKK